MPKSLSSLMRGAGSVLEILPPPLTLQFGSDILAVSDAEAIGRDWQAVGNDLCAAVRQAETEERRHVESEPRKARAGRTSDSTDDTLPHTAAG